VNSYRREIDRGVTTLQAQMREVAHDLAEFKGETQAWQAAHNLRHTEDSRDRLSGRRWLIATAIAALAAMGTVLGLLIEILGQVRR